MVLDSWLSATCSAVIVQFLLIASHGSNRLALCESVVTNVTPTQSVETVMSTHTRSTKSVIFKTKTVDVVTTGVTSEHAILHVSLLSQ